MGGVRSLYFFIFKLFCKGAGGDDCGVYMYIFGEGTGAPRCGSLHQGFCIFNTVHTLVSVASLAF